MIVADENLDFQKGVVWDLYYREGRLNLEEKRREERRREEKRREEKRREEKRREEKNNRLR